MSGNTIPPKLSLAATSEAFAAKAHRLNASSKAGPSNPGNALADKRCTVGAGESREKAQSAAVSVKSLFTSLHNGFKSILYCAAALLKPLTSYAFRSSDAQTAPGPKKAMKMASGAMAQGAASVTGFLNANALTKDTYRGARDALNPPSSTLDSLAREADDALADIQGASESLISETRGFLKKLF